MAVVQRTPIGDCLYVIHASFELAEQVYGLLQDGDKQKWVCHGVYLAWENTGVLVL